MKNIIVIGTGGLAREFSSYFCDNFKIIGFSSTNLTEHSEFNLPGQLFEGEITPDKVGTSEAVIAIGSPAVKKKISDKLKLLGFTFPHIIHPSSVVSDRTSIDEGVVISPNCVISPNVNLQAFSYLNFCCGVGHDAVIEPYVQINPGVQLGGFSKIGEGSLIGSGSVILQGVKIGNNATIASGSVIFTNVAEGSTMMGNPAKRMRAFEK